MSKKIAVGADHAGFPLKNPVIKYLKDNGYEVLDFGTNSTDPVDYPDYAEKVGEAIKDGKADMGIVL
jgi:ribose 5-phosphate isomerase B